MGISWDSGRENGNYYLGFRVSLKVRVPLRGSHKKDFSILGLYWGAPPCGSYHATFSLATLQNSSRLLKPPIQFSEPLSISPLETLHVDRPGEKTLQVCKPLENLLNIFSNLAIKLMNPLLAFNSLF